MFIEFFQENLLYFGLLLTLVLMLAYDIQKNSLGGTKKVFPSKVPFLQKEQELFILDVSPTKSFENGHILGAVNIPANKFSAEEKKFNADNDHTVLVVDQNGMHAGGVANKIKKAGFANVLILDGGIAAWQKENFPLTKT